MPGNLGRRADEIGRCIAQFVSRLHIHHVAAIAEDELPHHAHLLECLAQGGNVEPCAFQRCRVVAAIYTISPAWSVGIAVAQRRLGIAVGYGVLFDNPAAGVSPKYQAIVFRGRAEIDGALQHLGHALGVGGQEVFAVFIQFLLLAVGSHLGDIRFLRTRGPIDEQHQIVVGRSQLPTTYDFIDVVLQVSR